MIYSHEVEKMCPVAQGVNHGAAPIPEEAKWVKVKDVADISGLTHGIGWCAPQQGACKLTLNVKEGIIQEALFGKYTFSCTTLIGFIVGLAAGMLFGPYPEGASIGHSHYGWAIWGAIFLVSIMMGIIVERYKKSDSKASA